MMADPFGLYRELTALRHIKRFQQHPTVAPMSVAEHSFYVAVLAGTFARQLAADPFKVTVDAAQAMELGLWHDAAEAAMGDTPHQVKRLSRTLEAEWEHLERKACWRLWGLAGMPVEEWDNRADASLEALLVKIADWTELVLYVFEERVSGNRAIDRAATRIFDLMDHWLPQLVAGHGVMVTGWYHDHVAALRAAEAHASEALRGFQVE